MRSFHSHSVIAARPTRAESWFPGLPHAIAAVAIWPVFGLAACIAGLLMASLVSFVVWLPLTALALNHGEPLRPGDEAPALTLNARRALFVLWTVTAWLAAAIAR